MKIELKTPPRFDTAAMVLEQLRERIKLTAGLIDDHLQGDGARTTATEVRMRMAQGHPWAPPTKP